MVKINLTKLHHELEAAGIHIQGVNSTGEVWDMDGKDIQDRKDVQAIIANHDPTPEPIETQEEKITRIIKAEVIAEVAKEIIANNILKDEVV